MDQQITAVVVQQPSFPRHNAANRPDERPHFPREEEWVTRDEAAAYLKLSKKSLACDVQSKRLRIPFYRFGKAVRYKMSDLRSWAEAHRAK
jgi:excisionase family DNA binding protein